MKIKKGDIVMVLAGKDAGRKGKVLRVMPREQRVVVEGINRVKRHQRPSRTIPQGGIFQIENPMNLSNVMLVCDKCNDPVRVGITVLESGEKVRFCRKCGEVID